MLDDNGGLFVGGDTNQKDQVLEATKCEAAVKVILPSEATLSLLGSFFRRSE